MWTALSAFTNGGATVPLVMLTMFLPVKWMQDSVNFFGNPALGGAFQKHLWALKSKSS